MAHVEYRNLSVETNPSARHQRLFVFDAGAIDRVARGEIVATIEDHIGGGNVLFQRLPGQPLREGNDLYIGIDFK